MDHTNRKKMKKTMPELAAKDNSSSEDEASMDSSSSSSNNSDDHEESDHEDEDDDDDDHDKKRSSKVALTPAVVNRTTSVVTTTTSASDDANASASASSGKRKRVANSGMSASDRWEWMYQRLQQFKELHHHCNVPNRFPEDPSLGCWVSTQRRHYKKSKVKPGEGLSREREAKLEQLGFEWTGENPRHKNWDIRFEELKKFKAQYGHAQVPIGFEDNVQLANWTSTQRQEYKNLLKGKPSRLSEHRIKLLNDIGFAWELQRGGRRRRVTITRDGMDDELDVASDGTSTKVERNSNTDVRDEVKASLHSHPFSTSLVLPGVALIGGNQNAQNEAPSPSSTQKYTISTAPVSTAATSGASYTTVRSGIGGSEQTDERQGTARPELSESGAAASNFAANALPVVGNSSNATEANITGQSGSWTPTSLDTILLRAQLMGLHHSSGPTSLVQALAEAPLSSLANAPASQLSAYQQALLSNLQGTGLALNPMLNQNLAAASGGLLLRGTWPFNSLLQAQANANNMLQHQVINQGQQHSFMGASYPPSWLTQAANLLLLQQRQQQQASWVPDLDLAASLATHELNRRHQQEGPSSAAERHPFAEAKADDTTFHQGPAYRPGG